MVKPRSHAFDRAVSRPVVTCKGHFGQQKHVDVMQLPTPGPCAEPSAIVFRCDLLQRRDLPLLAAWAYAASSSLSACCREASGSMKTGVHWQHAIRMVAA